MRKWVSRSRITPEPYVEGTGDREGLATPRTTGRPCRHPEPAGDGDSPVPSPRRRACPLFAAEDEPAALSLEHDHFALGGVIQDSKPVLPGFRGGDLPHVYNVHNHAGRGVKTATVDAAEKILGLTIRGRYDRPTRGARPSSPSPLVSDGLADPLGHRRHLALFPLP